MIDEAITDGAVTDAVEGDGAVSSAVDNSIEDSAGEAEPIGDTTADGISEGEQETEDGNQQIDYEQLMADDLATLKSEFKELEGLGSISELDNPLRYAALRDMGLTPQEAYMASSAARRKSDGRAHLVSAVPKSAAMPKSSISHSELVAAREILNGLSDTEIYNLYKRVTAR